jgi:hypothetical protein
MISDLRRPSLMAVWLLIGGPRIDQGRAHARNVDYTHIEMIGVFFSEDGDSHAKRSLGEYINQ